MIQLSEWPRMHHARLGIASLLLALTACGHSDAFNLPADQPTTTFTSGSAVRITFNPENDYWPAWTQDGRGILYAYARQTVDSNRRCIAMLPANGASATWSMCDDRIIMRDSMTSFPAFALGDDGRLLYTEITADTIRRTSTASNKLWLADSARPFQRTEVLSMPAQGWLADIRWTGPTTFVALRQSLTTLADQCSRGPCLFPVDSIWGSGTVVTGNVGSSTLTDVAGTTGATTYSLAENGTSIVFAAGTNTIRKVPVGGGTSSLVASLPDVGPHGGANILLGVSCRGTVCVAAMSPVVTSGPGMGFAGGTSILYAVSTTSGSVQPIFSTMSGVLATPVLSPVNGNVVAQIGGGLGHLSTAALSSHSDLEFFTGLVP